MQYKNILRIVTILFLNYKFTIIASELNLQSTNKIATTNSELNTVYTYNPDKPYEPVKKLKSSNINDKADTVLLKNPSTKINLNKYDNKKLNKPKITSPLKYKPNKLNFKTFAIKGRVFQPRIKFSHHKDTLDKLDETLNAPFMNKLLGSYTLD